RGLAGLSYVAADVVQNALLGLCHGQSSIQRIQQSGCLVHAAYEVTHLFQRPVAWLDHQIDSVSKDIEVGVGDQHGYADRLTVDQVESGHLAVHPDQEVACGHLAFLCVSSVSCPMGSW